MTASISSICLATSALLILFLDAIGVQKLSESSTQRSLMPLVGSSDTISNACIPSFASAVNEEQKKPLTMWVRGRVLHAARL